MKYDLHMKEGFIMKLKEWTNMWNEKIKRWSKEPELYSQNDCIYNAYKPSKKSDELIKSALLEPYLGDIDNKCSTVFLTLNPGDTLPDGEQMLPEGKFIKDGAVACYNEWAKKWVYLNDHSNINTSGQAERSG